MLIFAMIRGRSYRFLGMIKKGTTVSELSPEPFPAQAVFLPNCSVQLIVP